MRHNRLLNIQASRSMAIEFAQSHKKCFVRIDNPILKSTLAGEGSSSQAWMPQTEFI